MAVLVIFGSALSHIYHFSCKEVKLIKSRQLRSCNLLKFFYSPLMVFEKVFYKWCSSVSGQSQIYDYFSNSDIIQKYRISLFNLDKFEKLQNHHLCSFFILKEAR